MTATARHRRRPGRRRRALAWLHACRPQWPGWLLDWAWERQATPYQPPMVVRVAAHAIPPLERACKPGYEFPTDTWLAYREGMQP